MVDPSGREILASVGCFVENLTLAAAALGRYVAASILPEATPTGDVALVELSDGQGAAPVPRGVDRAPKDHPKGDVANAAGGRHSRPPAFGRRPGSKVPPRR